MLIQSKSLSTYIISTILILLYFIGKINGDEQSRTLDETVASPGLSDPSLKCGGCSPCGHPSCYQSPPPPPPPPPPKKPPSTRYCPPPPCPWIYAPGPPGGLYPVDPSYSYYSGAVVNFAATLKIFVGYGLLELIVLWM
ncbi:hypothetical protein RND81_02G185600 [Saponaria officinalis]|uniref:Uncharacterized protein n=1 Tax=Saponaria officinalis TaxID=3572 RepID=A0AAW1MUJ9_SAPOF